jgi:hypothetical protein
VRRLTRSPLIAFLLALLLLGGQGVAFAHMVGHAGASAVTVAHDGDEGHGAALSLSHACTTCLGAAALAGAAPLPMSPALPVVVAAAAPWPGATAPRLPAGSAAGYLPRGPPGLL